MACEKPQSSDVSVLEMPKTPIPFGNSHENFYILDKGRINIPFNTNNNQKAYILDPDTGRIEYKYETTEGWEEGGYLPSLLSLKGRYQCFSDFEQDFKQMANHIDDGFINIQSAHIEAVYAHIYKPREVQEVQERANNDAKILKVEIERKNYALQDIPNLEQENIDAAVGYLKNALDRLLENDQFRTITNVDQQTISTYLPLMVKESLLLSNAESRSNGPYGYFQIDKPASNDAQRFIRDNLNVYRKYNRKNPEDNCVLGIVYFILMKKGLETVPFLDVKDIDKFTLFAYNAGLGNTKDIINLYIKEAPNDNSISWDEFASWIVKEMGYTGLASPAQDVVYLGQYHDWFDGKNEGKKDEKFNKNAGVSRGKIFEAINYVEKIENISSHSLLTKSELAAREIEQSAVIDYMVKKLGKGSNLSSLLKDEGLDTKHAKRLFAFNKQHNPRFKTIKDASFIPAGTDVWLPEWSTGFYTGNKGITPPSNETFSTPKKSIEIPEESTLDQSVVIDYMVKKLGKGSNLSSLLKDEGLDTKHAKRLFAFNKQHNPRFKTIKDASFIPAGTDVWLPEWSTGFYTGNKGITSPSNETSRAPKKSIETSKKGTFNFNEWIKTIEVLGDDLKGKVFVLDPGHGGPDLGAHPIARSGSGSPIKDHQSGVKYTSPGDTDRVKSGRGSGYLHVYESLVTVDVSYRLAKLLRQQGAEVHVTRYNKTTGIIDTANMTTPATSEDIYSDTKKSWKYSRDGDKIRIRRGLSIANSILKNANKKQEDIYFLSIHADRLGKSSNPSINFRYYSRIKKVSGKKDVIIKSKTGETFASQLAGNTTSRNGQAGKGGQELGIVHPDRNGIDQSVLIELANMNNPNAAYVLRQPGTMRNEKGEIIPGRQQFADELFQGITKTVAQQRADAKKEKAKGKKKK